MEQQPENISLGEAARVVVLASEDVARELVSVLSLSARAGLAAEVEALEGAAGPAASPDLVVCEIRDGRQAAESCRELSARWPAALLVSCELSRQNGHAGAAELRDASREAGYQGHMLLNEAALHLPFFLRYAERRRVSERRQAERESHLTNLLAAARRMHASLDQQHVSGVVLEEFSRRVGADKWLLYMLSDDGQSLELVRGEGTKTRPQSLTLAVTGPGIVESTLRLKEIVVTNHCGSVEPNHPEGNHYESSQPIMSEPPAESALCLPLAVEGQVVGVAEAVRAAGREHFGERDSRSLGELAPMAASALFNAAQFARAERLYMQDDLTQLYNSRYLRQFLENELRRAKRYGNPVAVIFMDLDGFKGVNDTFGHRVGSETLREVALLLAASVRDTDVVARYGGDEFTLVLPETTAEKSVITAERVRQRVAEYEFRGGGAQTFHLTASFGIAAFPEHQVASAADLLEKADLAMYEAKAAHKNNVKLAR